MITAATALTGTHEHIDGYMALHMDPNAEGSLEHVRLLDDFVLSHMATADIDYFEGYPGSD